MRVIKRLLLVLFIALVAAAAGAWIFFDRITIAAVTPRVPFDPSRVPPAPDYTRTSAWSARPDMNDLADVVIEGLPKAKIEDTRADVFYVHPTSFITPQWNAAIDDIEVNRATDRGATRIQASAFNGCCAVYAPRYRQANLVAFTSPTSSGAQARKIAGDDVVAAFRHYLDKESKGRPFIIAAHSQGSAHALRLLRDVVLADATGALKKRLVAAYLLGGPLTTAELASTGLPACAKADDTGCVVAFNARSRDYEDHGLDFVVHKGATLADRVCVNPLTWSNDDKKGVREMHKGSVFFGGDGFDDPLLGKSIGSARCAQGRLVIELLESPPRDFMSRLLDHAIGDGNYHPMEYGLFFVDLRDNAAQRVAAWIARP
jgi:hypothetical protein